MAHAVCCLAGLPMVVLFLPRCTSIVGRVYVDTAVSRLSEVAVFRGWLFAGRWSAAYFDFVLFCRVHCRTDSRLVVVVVVNGGGSGLGRGCFPDLPVLGDTTGCSARAS